MAGSVPSQPYTQYKRLGYDVNRRHVALFRLFITLTHPVKRRIMLDKAWRGQDSTGRSR